jgi:membrane-associated phospholipid phosphatase
MKQKIINCIFAFCCSPVLFGQNSSEEVFSEDSIFYEQSALKAFSTSETAFQYPAKESSVVPLSKLFYKMGSNVLHSFTYNYGLNYGVAALGTYGIIESGIDWKWNRMAYNNEWVAWSGTPFGALGYIVPVAAPVWLYVRGRKHNDIKLQVTGLALGQSALLGLGVSCGIKAFTGRRAPGILEHHIFPDKYSDTDDYSRDWAFGFMRRGVNSGWPSSHTMVSFAMATTLAELYPDNQWLKIGAFTYAGCVGVGVSLFSHWSSEVFAGALIGYAIGKSVGHSFNQLLDNNNKAKISYSLYATPDGIGLTVNF